MRLDSVVELSQILYLTAVVETGWYSIEQKYII